MKRVSEYIKIQPIFANFSTAAATSVEKVRIDGNDNICVVVGSRFGSTIASGLGVTATAANYVQFSVLESTGATANASAITGATVTLGAATAAQARGVVQAVLTVTSNLTTATEIQINGITYRTTQTGVGTSGEGVAQKLASAINGNATSDKLPHYRAVENYGATGQILIEADDDMGTGLTLITTAAAATIAPTMTWVQGAIEIDRSKFSTNTPKYISVSLTTFNGTTAVNYAFVVRKPTVAPAFSGRVISLTT